MKFFFSIIFLVIFIITKSLSADSVSIKSILLPEKNYSTYITKNTKAVMKFSGEKEYIHVLKINGYTSPLTQEIKQEFEAIFNTGSVFNYNEFPFVFHFDKILYKENINGYDLITGREPLLNKNAYGRVLINSSFFTIDSLDIADETRELKFIINRSIGHLINLIELPMEPIVIGDTIISSTPEQLDVIGKPYKVNLTTKRVLQKVENNKAYFDLHAEIEMKLDNKELLVKFKGKGSGYLVHDMINSFSTEVIINYNVEVEFKSPKINVKGKISKSEIYKTIIEDKPENSKIN